jgi:hypothetical protein
MIYEAADYGGLGTVEEVERVGLYDFHSYLAYKRSAQA